MKIYTLESKNEVLAILTHNDNMSYRDFKNICQEASEGTDNDFYSLKDILINDYKFQIVEACGGYEVNKNEVRSNGDCCSYLFGIYSYYSSFNIGGLK